MLGPEIASFPSLDVTAGVRGGECMAETGGECRGDGAAEPAGSLREGVIEPDGT